MDTAISIRLSPEMSLALPRVQASQPTSHASSALLFVLAEPFYLPQSLEQRHAGHVANDEQSNPDEVDERDAGTRPEFSVTTLYEINI